MKPPSRSTALKLALAIVLAAGSLASVAGPQPAGADHVLLASVTDDLQETVIKTTGYVRGGVEIGLGDHQITVTLINGALNDGSRAERGREASKISAAISGTIAGKADFAGIHIIHVDYIRRSGDDSAVVQGIDFREAPDGSFGFHTS